MIEGLHRLARRYARALYALSQHTVSADLLERLERWGALWAPRQKATSYLRLHCIDTEAQLRIIRQSLVDNEIKKIVEPLLELLARHKRLWLVGAVVQAYVAWYRRIAQIQVVEVSTVDRLTDEEVATIREWITRATGAHEVRLQMVIDPSLIAGIRLKSSTFLWEYSVRQHVSLLAARCG
jgi:ATP synthase F1 delta subunit